MDIKTLKIGFIGGGNMARAIGGSLLKNKTVEPNNVWVSAQTERTFPFWRSLNANVTLDNNKVLNVCDVIIFAVKPQMLNDVVDDMNCTLGEEKLVISLMAGITIDSLITKCRLFSCRVIRAMPNTPISVGHGVTVYCGRNTTTYDDEVMEKIFAQSSTVEKVAESLINAIGGLTGCGPAYAYLMIEALSDGATRMGVPRSLATKFAASVLVGAGKMVLETGQHPGQLKDEVCSPGGSTIAGIHAMEEGKVRAALMNAVAAATKRSEELARLS